MLTLVQWGSVYEKYQLYFNLFIKCSKSQYYLLDIDIDILLSRCHILKQQMKKKKSDQNKYYKKKNSL